MIVIVHVFCQTKLDAFSMFEVLTINTLLCCANDCILNLPEKTTTITTTPTPTLLITTTIYY